MNVLILGSGGREHTLAWKLAKSPGLTKLFVAPGNAGTAAIGENLPLNLNDFDAIKTAVLERHIGMVVVGPEDPLVNGIHDYFIGDQTVRHIPVIGPMKAAATLEGSKEFAKEFMIRHNIPTAAYRSFTGGELKDGYKFLESLQPPYVLKADGLAAGKGVLILHSLEEARKELRDMLQGAKFGAASAKVVIEEFLSGIELSCFVLTDGLHFKVLPMAKDYKRIGEGDTGLNTGGMGAVSPVSFATPVFEDKILNRIVKPTIEGLRKDSLPYKGFIFIGLIKVGDEPMVIEYNVRLGDPETEVVVPRIKNDLLEVFKAVAAQTLDTIELETDRRVATTIVAVSGGYPGEYEKGKTISGLDAPKDAILFHAGTKHSNNQVVTNGGRVIAVTTMGADSDEALTKGYKALREIDFEGMYYRKDIGFDL